MSIATDDLRTIDLFEGCKDDDLVLVAGAVRGIRTVAEGQAVCRAGDVANEWWVVDEGVADVTVDGLYVGTIGPGETIGELALLDGLPRTADVTAQTEMRLYEIDGKTFVDALARSSELALALLRELAGRMRVSNQGKRNEPSVVPAAPAAPPTTGPAPKYDPFAPGYFADPSVQLNAIREAGGLQPMELTGGYLVTRYDDVHRLIRDRTLEASIENAASTPAVDAEKQQAREGNVGLMMVRRDGEDHLRLRRLVSRAFTPKAIGRMRDWVTEVTDGLLDEAAGRDEIDVIADFARPLPIAVISAMLGLPHGDFPQLREWSHTMTQTADPIFTPEEGAASLEAGRNMGTYLAEQIEHKRANPGDDILSTLIHAEQDGDRLTFHELMAQLVLLYIAGHETTVNLIGNGLTHLFAFPAELDRLRVDPGLDTNAVEEVLRFDSPAQLARRVTVEPLEIDGSRVPAGSVVWLALHAANHDPRKWGPTADVLDLARPGANEHVSFGGGAHHCLGAFLARLEGQVALPRLVRRFPRMAPAYDEPAWASRMLLRGVERLPVTLG